MSYNSGVMGLVISNYSPITPLIILHSVLLPLLIVPQIPLKSKWRKSTYSNITLTLSQNQPSPFPPSPLPHFLGFGTFALNSQNYNPLFGKILDPPLQYDHLNTWCYQLQYNIKQIELRKYKYN